MLTIVPQASDRVYEHQADAIRDYLERTTPATRLTTFRRQSPATGKDDPVVDPLRVTY